MNLLIFATPRAQWQVGQYYYNQGGGEDMRMAEWTFQTLSLGSNHLDPELRYHAEMMAGLAAEKRQGWSLRVGRGIDSNFDQAARCCSRNQSGKSAESFGPERIPVALPVSSWTIEDIADLRKERRSETAASEN